MLYLIVLFVILAILANSFCIASSRFNNKQAGSLKEPLLKEVDLEKGAQPKSLAAAEAARAAAQKQAERALAPAARAEAILESTKKKYRKGETRCLADCQAVVSD